MWIEAIVAGTKTWEEVEDERGERKLDEHVETGREEGIVEVEVVFVEHPFIVLRTELVRRTAYSEMDEAQRLTIDIESEKKYLQQTR